MRVLIATTLAGAMLCGVTVAASAASPQPHAVTPRSRKFKAANACGVTVLSIMERWSDVDHAIIELRRPELSSMSRPVPAAPLTSRCTGSPR